MCDHSPPVVRPLWASVADGFYVGSREGSFLGYIDRQPDGAWRAFDAASRVLGDHADHHRAMAAVTAGAEADAVEREQEDAG
ncbi:hypothetical protein HWD99_17680 [Microbacterium sp. C5A9]|uniref:hypothetical protein n=1 Tax=Microbacterium sp. C5A9 TaxID=2736663 RepID=UPI001F520325|nr:hypothetical protein [Microbacterium sp. C5A9]MCI1020461.1 hypothetical protein [Microbacterium sp. C5A9]